MISIALSAVILTPALPAKLPETFLVERRIVKMGRHLPTESQWEALRHCESRGRYNAVSKTGKYRGAYQFDRRTWASYGKPGDPALASKMEQDLRAKKLYASRGASPWPYCGKYLRGKR